MEILRPSFTDYIAIIVIESYFQFQRSNDKDEYVITPVTIFSTKWKHASTFLASHDGVLIFPLTIHRRNLKTLRSTCLCIISIVLLAKCHLIESSIDFEIRYVNNNSMNKRFLTFNLTSKILDLSRWVVKWPLETKCYIVCYECILATDTTTRRRTRQMTH